MNSTISNDQTENSVLLKFKNESLPNTVPVSSKSFAIAHSFNEELKLTFQRCMLISVQMLAELGSIVVALIMVGHLPDSAKYLSGVGLARTFVNVTGTAMAWGFTTALYTLIPQCIGYGNVGLASIHIQRAFYVVTFISGCLSIIQFYAGDIMVSIGQPTELTEIVNSYCRLLIPYIFLTAYGAILQRLAQALDYNIGLVWCGLLMLASTPVLTYLFMYYFEYGYLGAAIAQCFVMLIYILSIFIMLIYRGFAYMFKPISFKKVFTIRGMYQYISLAIPGLFQNAFEWIINEAAVIFAGYIVQAKVALSTTVILSNLFLIVISLSIGTCNAVNLRVGKYIGNSQILSAKRASKVGILIGFAIIFTITLVFVCGDNVIPKIYTNDQLTIQLTSEMIYILIIYSAGCVILQTVGGIYRGLGFQKVAAIFVFVSYWIISLPLTIILLFEYKYKNDLHYGVGIIWSGLAFGNILASIACVIYLLFFTNWDNAVKQSTKRIIHNIKEYNSTTK